MCYGLYDDFHKNVIDGLVQLKGQAYEELDVNQVDLIYEETLLHDACWYGDKKLVQSLLDHPRIDVNIKSKDGETSLMYAVRSQDSTSVIQLLKDRRVDINIIDNRGNTPFTEACKLSETEAMELFIIYRCDEVIIPPGFADSICLKEGDEESETHYYCVVQSLKECEKDRHLFRRNLFLGHPYDSMRGEYIPQQIFLLSELYKAKGENTIQKRFFDILSQLPTELKMLICNFAGGSTRNFISSQSLLTEMRFLKYLETE